MSRVCEICGKKPMAGHRVSHAHNLKNRRWLPNLQSINVRVDGKPMKKVVCTSCIRSGSIKKK